MKGTSYELIILCGGEVIIKKCKDCKVIPGKSVKIQNRLIVIKILCRKNTKDREVINKSIELLDGEFPKKGSRSNQMKFCYMGCNKRRSMYFG